MKNLNWSININFYAGKMNVKIMFSRIVKLKLLNSIRITSKMGNQKPFFNFFLDCFKLAFAIENFKFLIPLCL